MATSRTRPAHDDEPLSAADRAAIDRALSEPGITLSADELAALLAAGGDDEVCDLIAAGQVAKAIALRASFANGVAKCNAFEQQHPFAQRDQIARQRGA